MKEERTGIALVGFTECGNALAEKLSALLNGSVRKPGISLDAWTRDCFAHCEALIFIGAAGIAVRAVAPYVQSKLSDPAVVCVDEKAQWVIPLLSGHLGGANTLARKIAALTGGEAVITTATDLNGAFAVDLWAKKQGLILLQPSRIRIVSSDILRGDTIRIAGCFPEGTPPDQVETEDSENEADVLISYRESGTDALQLVPRVLTLGIGCRRGVRADLLEDLFCQFCRERGILPQAVEQAASIDRKMEEEGLLTFCANRGFPLHFFSAGELLSAEGDYSASDFVERTVGVDNVCERAAVLATGGILTERKFACEGVTFALAERTAIYDWSM